MTELGDHKNMLSADEQATLVEALMAIRSKVCWKPGKDVVIIRNGRTWDTCQRHAL